MTLTPIFDGHNDTLLRVFREADFHFLQENPTGHLDLPRARRGGMAGGIFAIFSPTPEGSPEKAEMWEMTFPATGGYIQKLHSAIDPEYARLVTTAVVESLGALLEESNGALRLVRTAAEIERCMADGVLAVVLHFEGAEAIRADLSNLEEFYRQGLRSLGLVWSRPNAFAEGVPFCYPSSPDTGPGLTPAGVELVRACNRLRIMIDLAHINEKGFWDVARLSKAPLVVSHTDVHAITPSTRNVTDAQIDAVAASGGVIGLNFEPIQITPEANSDLSVPLSQLVRHVDYIANRVGIDTVAFGSDFDGTNMPAELGSAAGLQNLAGALRAAGYDEESVEKVCWRNWLRVLRATWGG